MSVPDGAWVVLGSLTTGLITGLVAPWVIGRIQRAQEDRRAGADRVRAVIERKQEAYAELVQVSADFRSAMWSLENHKVSAAEESTIVELRRAVQEAMATLHAKIALAEFYSDDDVLEALEALRQASRVAATEGVKGSHVVWHRERFLEKESELLKSMRESIQRLES